VPVQQDNQESKVMHQFARFAHEYSRYNIIQREVAKTLVGQLPHKRYTCIVDIGCGSGTVHKIIDRLKIEVDNYIALDASSEMLALHPSKQNIQKIHANFNDKETFENLDIRKEETFFLSSSALQWSKDLEFTFSQLAHKSKYAYFAIFTANTFKTLHKIADVQSPIYSEKRLKEVISTYYDAKFQLKRYKLEFKSVRDMFKYIKKSGVSGGDKQLSYTQMKTVMDTYPLKYLEFEVLFVEATSLA